MFSFFFFLLLLKVYDFTKTLFVAGGPISRDEAHHTQTLFTPAPIDIPKTFKRNNEIQVAASVA